MTIRNLDTHVVIKWRVTDRCNYSCSYCIRRMQASRSGETDYDKVAVAKNIAQYIVPRLAELKPVKVDLIGGEVTLLSEFNDIVESLFAGGVDKVNVTTNLSVPITSPYVDRLSFTCSYHPENAGDMGIWFDRAVELKHRCRYLKVETVRTLNATHIDEFVAKAKELNLDYMVEGDLLVPALKGERLISKPSDRYEVTFDDGRTERFATRNSFLKQHGVGGMVVNTDGLLCTRDYDYVYVEFDKVRTCRGDRPFDKYIMAEKPHPCHRGKNGKCTLCGNMSLFDSKEVQ